MGSGKLNKLGSDIARMGRIPFYGILRDLIFSFARAYLPISLSVASSLAQLPTSIIGTKLHLRFLPVQPI